MKTTDFRPLARLLSLVLPVSALAACSAIADAPAADSSNLGTASSAEFDPALGFDPNILKDFQADIAARKTTPAGCIGGDSQKLDANGNITVRGYWTETSPPTSLVVDGKAVTVDPDNGFWSLTRKGKVGLNLFRAVSKNAQGKWHNNVCSVYVAPGMLLDSKTRLKNAVVLGLRQGGIDDGAPNVPVTSVADVMRAVLAGPALHDSIDKELTKKVGRKNLGGAIADYSYIYRSIAFDTPEFTLDLVSGDALRVHVAISNLSVSGKIDRDGPITNTKRELDGTIGRISVDFDLRVDSSNGKAYVTSTIADGGLVVSPPHFSGEGVIGDVGAAVANLFLSGTAQAAIEVAIVNAVSDKAPDALEKLINNMIAGGPGSETINVPNVDSAGVTKVTIDTQLGEVSFTDNGAMVVGFDTLASSTVPFNTKDPVLLLGNDGTLPPVFTQTGTSSAFTHVGAGAVSPGIAGLAMRALFRAGYFDITKGALDLHTLVTPMVYGTATGVRASIGPIAATISPPGAPSFKGFLFASVDVPVQRSGTQAVAFGTPVVDDVFFDPTNIEGAAAFILPPVIESQVEAVLQLAVDHAFDGIGALTIPSFSLPASFAGFDLPAGGRFGVVGATVGVSNDYVTLQGQIGKL